MSLATKSRARRALRDVERGKSIRQSSRDHDVERTYIRRRIDGVPTRKEADEAKQKLSKTQEDSLARWVVVQGKLGYAPPHARFRAFAQQLLTNSGSTERLGNKWVTRFLGRHPEIRTLKGIAMDYKRLNGATPTSARALHSRLDLKEVIKISSSNRYNVDEIGLMEGMGENDLVLGEARRSRIFLKDAFKRVWITVMVCVSADGRALPPLVIFAGASVQQQWLGQDPTRYEDWYFTTTTNGWTNTEVGLKWLREVFIPNSRPADPKEWRLLILDGHNSHTTEEFMTLCLVNKIYVIYLPAHSSQAFQPLDVGVFNYLKRRFRHHFRERCFDRASESTDKVDFLWALSRAWQDTMGRKKFILTGWEASGMWPVSLEKSLNSRFVKESPEAERAAIVTESSHEEPDFLADMAAFPAKTPASSRELNELQKKWAKADAFFAKPTTRLLFRKLGKALDLSNFEITATYQQVSQLTQALENAKPQKRKKVLPAPNEDFVRLKGIREVKGGVQTPKLRTNVVTRARSAEIEEIHESEAESEVGSCIIVGIQKE